MAKFMLVLFLIGAAADALTPAEPPLLIDESSPAAAR